MSILIRSLGVIALTTASVAAHADAHFNIDINPFGWGAPPPVVYESPRYYAPPPVVYYGRGHWGDHREGRGRGEHERGRWDHHNNGDRRR
jgi:hypothetical protein